MRPTFTVAACACTLAFFLIFPATAAASEALGAVAAAGHVLHGPGAVALVRKKNSILLRRAYGMANIELGVPMRAHHVFRVGSISKTFTAVAVMQLAERGSIDLAAPVRRYLPTLPESWAAITVEHLLLHVSGIPNLENMPGFQAFQTQARTLEETIAWFSSAALEFAPGTRSRYSSSGYIVLGKLIESVSGLGYEAYLQHHVFLPLKLRSTAYGDESAVVPGMASGYRAGGRRADFISMSVPHAAGALISTADDLAEFTLALHGGRLVSAASYARMITPHPSSEGEAVRFGYGLVLREHAGQKLIGHSGGIEGFSADVEFDPAAKAVAVVLRNTQEDPESASRIAATLMVRAFGKQIAGQRAPQLNGRQLQALAGIYPGVSTSRVIRLEQGRLTEQVNGGVPIALSMVSASEAVVPGTNRRLRFSLKDGRAVSVQAYAGDKEDGERAMRASTNGARHPVTLSEFADFAGDYALTERIDVTVLARDGKFYMQASGQPSLEIFAQSPTRFSAREVLISIEFSRDAAGKVSHLTLYQGDVAMPAARKQ